MKANSFGGVRERESGDDGGDIGWWVDIVDDDTHPSMMIVFGENWDSSSVHTDFLPHVPPTASPPQPTLANSSAAPVVIRCANAL